MGWSFMQSRNGLSVREYCDKQLTWSNEAGERRVLKSAMHGSTYYAAVEFTGKNGERQVWAAVFLTKSNPRAKDGFTFGYKDMSEDCGPFYYDCPPSILNLLTPTTSEAANEWRAKCRERTATKTKRPKAGDKIRLSRPIRFTNGAELDTFTVEKQPRMSGGFRTVYRGPDGLSYRFNPHGIGFTIAA